MCSLLVLVGVDRDHPIVVAANRDELRARPAAPPGLFVGARRRILSPRDRTAGGTWMGVNDRLWFAGLTNIADAPRRPGAPSRGHLPHLALDSDDLDEAADKVAAAVARAPHDAFRLLLTDGRRTLVLEHEQGTVRAIEPAGPLVTMTNVHGPGGLSVPGLAEAAVPGLGPSERLDRLAPLLLDTGARSGHAILKKGGDYGTVSSSLLAVPAADPSRLLWRYAPGPPDVTPYRDYGNLGKRLVTP